MARLGTVWFEDRGVIDLGNIVLNRCSTVVAALGALFVVGVSLLQLGVTLGLLDFGAKTGRLSSPYNLPLLLIGYAGVLVWIAAPFALVIYESSSGWHSPKNSKSCHVASLAWRLA